MTIEKKVLSNGLTVLVKPNHVIPKVSIQLWYGVGSKDEKTGEKGIAHLIEHMIFKGTKQLLSETDIKAVVHMLSGDCNAFTSYDYTGYKFNMPTHNWREILPIMADCMVNAAFKDEHLNSEMKAVIQELKMIKDNHTRSIMYDLLTTIFPDHPYHYPLIGYKQDLWSVRGKDLERFYKKHYQPNNATLVVVGDVEPTEVFALAEQYFGSIPSSGKVHEREEFYHNPDIAAKSVLLYRDVQQPTGVVAFVIPGAKAKQADIIDVASIILGSGKSSRLYRKLVEEDNLATSISASSIDLFDHGLFMIVYTPKNVADIARIELEIQKILEDIVQNGIQDHELHAALKKAKMQEYNLLESNETQAYLIGQYYLATGDPNYVFTYLDVDPKKLKADVQAFVQRYFRRSVMHKGLVLPLEQDDKAEWLRLQEAADVEDQRILSARQRENGVEDIKYATTLKTHTPKSFAYPKPTVTVLRNGMKMLSYANTQIPTVSLAIELKAKHWYDPQDKQGLLNFVTRMMTEGTKNYSAEQLADAVESRGMSLSVFPGGIYMNMLRSDLPKGLEFLMEILTQATFVEKNIEKVRSQLFVELKRFWDNPYACAGQLANELVYKGHPYSKNIVGTFASLESITRDDLVACYKKYISPDKASIAIVGDIKDLDLNKMLNESLGSWVGPKITDLDFPQLNQCCKGEINFPMNRDQVVLKYGGITVNRYHPDFDKLLLFDQIFGGGGLTSKLMQLREQTGLFYTIQGSTIAGAGEQPGALVISTIVSRDRLKEAEQAITYLIEHVADTITQKELIEAQNALAQLWIGFFASNASIAQAFLFLEKYGLPADYFDHRAQALARISLQEIKDTAKKYLKPENLCIVRVGRVS